MVNVFIANVLYKKKKPTKIHVLITAVKVKDGGNEAKFSLWRHWIYNNCYI